MQSFLLRSAQPLVGQQNVRSEQDEQLLNALAAHGPRGYIIDTRSQAVANAALQKGALPMLLLFMYSYAC